MTKRSINLLPQKSHQELLQEEKKEKSTYFFLAFPLLAIIAIVVLSAILLVQTKQIGDEKSKNDTLLQNIKDREQYRLENGELVSKVNALGNVVQNDINPSDYFSNVNATLSKYPAPVYLEKYEIFEDGTMAIYGKVESWLGFARVMRYFIEDPTYSKTDMSKVSYDKYQNLISFKIIFQYAKKTT